MLHLYSSCSLMPCLIRHSLLIKLITNTEAITAPFYEQIYSLLPSPRGLAVVSHIYLAISISQSLPLVLLYFMLLLEMGCWWSPQRGIIIQAWWEFGNNRRIENTSQLKYLPTLPTWEAPGAGWAVMDPSQIPKIFSSLPHLISCGLSFISVHDWQLTLFVRDVCHSWLPTLLWCVHSLLCCCVCQGTQWN